MQSGGEAASWHRSRSGRSTFVHEITLVYFRPCAWPAAFERAGRALADGAAEGLPRTAAEASIGVAEADSIGVAEASDLGLLRSRAPVIAGPGVSPSRSRRPLSR